MGDMGAWQQTEMGAVGQGRVSWVGGGVDRARDRQIEKKRCYKKKRLNDEVCLSRLVGTEEDISIKIAKNQ